jgi:hypothetical protein
MPSKRKHNPSAATRQARSELIALSCELNQSKALLAATTGIQLSTNELLLDTYRQRTGAQAFLRLQEWRALGYKVKAGEKAFRIWGCPIQVPKKRVDTDTAEDGSSAFAHWPMCCLFSEHQVELYTPAGSLQTLADEPARAALSQGRV